MWWRWRLSSHHRRLRKNAPPSTRSRWSTSILTTGLRTGADLSRGFLESTGLNGQSTLRKVKLETGAVVQQHRLDQAHFAEGLATWKGLIQLTWRSNIAFVYDLLTFTPRRTFKYPGEGGPDLRRKAVCSQRWNQPTAIPGSGDVP